MDCMYRQGVDIAFVLVRRKLHGPTIISNGHRKPIGDVTYAPHIQEQKVRQASKEKSAHLDEPAKLLKALETFGSRPPWQIGLVC